VTPSSSSSLSEPTSIGCFIDSGGRAELIVLLIIDDGDALLTEIFYSLLVLVLLVLWHDAHAERE